MIAFLFLLGNLDLIMDYRSVEKDVNFKKSPLIPDITSQERITGGEEADMHEFSFAVRLVLSDHKREIKCAGTLIHPKYFLSAAYCYFGRRFNYTKQIAYLGSHSTVEGNMYEVAVDIKNCYQENFDSARLLNDIMLCELVHEVRLSKQINIACIPSKDTERRGFEATTIGWGCIRFRPKEPSDVLRKVNIVVRSNAICKENDIQWDEESMICAGDSEGKRSTCRGDAGAPIFIRIKNLTLVFGVNSFIRPTGGINKLTYFAKISKYRNWIRSVLPDEICVI